MTGGSSSTPFVERRCRKCGTGTIRLMKHPVPTASTASARQQTPATYWMPTCDNCGAEWMNEEFANAYDVAVQTSNEPPLHAYTSTACLHNIHEECRRECKWCRGACQCPCHRGELTPEEQAFHGETEREGRV
jgi:hypothetical protein